MKTENKKSTIIICDDHPIFRQGLAQIIRDQETLDLVGECSNGNSAMQQIREKKPNLAILDVSMPEKDGISVAQTVLTEALPTKIIILTLHKDKTYFNKAIDAGVKGYLLKENATADVLLCIRKVLNNEFFVSSLLSNLLLQREKEIDSLLNDRPGIHTLTETEMKILRLIAQNKTSKQIASDLYISFRTVQNHRQHISDKLNLHGPHKLLQFAIENKSIIK